jgi:hypothetical protein
VSKGTPCSECGVTIDRHGARGWCARCYMNVRRAEVRAAGGKACAIEGCVNRIFHGGRHCYMHQNRIARHGDAGPPGRVIGFRGTTHYHIAAIRARILAEQDGKCLLCATTDSKRWVVDHDHACHPAGDFCDRCIRGVLCQACNVGLGMLQDDPVLMRRAADYVEQFRNRV